VLWGAHDIRSCAPLVSCTVSGTLNNYPSHRLIRERGASKSMYSTARANVREDSSIRRIYVVIMLILNTTCDYTYKHTRSPYAFSSTQQVHSQQLSNSPHVGVIGVPTRRGPARSLDDFKPPRLRARIGSARPRRPSGPPALPDASHDDNLTLHLHWV
jgi:hypothetical protein